MSLLAQIPKNLPNKFGFEINEFDLTREVIAQLKTFTATMIELGYTVYEMRDMSMDARKFTFVKK